MYQNPKTGAYTVPVPKSPLTGKFKSETSKKGVIRMGTRPTIEELEDAISGIYQEAAVRAPGVMMNHEAEPLRTLWALADAEYAKEDA